MFTCINGRQDDCIFIDLIFSRHPAAFGFQSSSPPDIITLTPANKRADLSLSDFQTGIGTAAHATFDIEHLISCIRTAFVDTIAFLWDSDGGVILVQEVLELLGFLIFCIMLYLSGSEIKLVL